MTRRQLRSLVRRGVRAVRALLVGLAIAGILPVNDVVAAFSESPEHTEAEPCGDDCAGGCVEKHCAPLDHHCRCCVASVVVPPDPVHVEQCATTGAAFAWEHARAVSRTLTPPTRPPIAA